ncbi:MAG: CDP-diacylglycerol--serine O-phosphatidyltransferase [Thermoplasmata archaeon]|nr:CDP-diacylglycerol--serine O-phosphatidyltransferase [Thermoplasmata archaeon]
MRWIRKVSIADYVTIANGLLGFLAITYIIDGKFIVAYMLLMVCILVDGIDGKLARFFKSKHHFGRYLDSFSDTISFCFAPAILLYSNFYDPSRGTAFTSIPNALAIVIPTVYLCFGILRLARFAAADYKEKNFLGLPTPATTFLVVNLCILFGTNALMFANEFLVLGVALGASLLMISDIPYPKIDGGLAPATGLAIVIGIASAILIEVGGLSLLALVLSTFALLSIILYVIGGPLYVRFSEREYISPEKV